jgi:hypothetical protein
MQGHLPGMLTRGGSRPPKMGACLILVAMVACDPAAPGSSVRVAPPVGADVPPPPQESLDKGANRATACVAAWPGGGGTLGPQVLRGRIQRPAGFDGPLLVELVEPPREGRGATRLGGARCDSDAPFELLLPSDLRSFHVVVFVDGDGDGPSPGDPAARTSTPLDPRQPLPEVALEPTPGARLSELALPWAQSKPG